MSFKTIFTVLGKSQNKGNLRTREEREMALDLLEAQGHVYGYGDESSRKKTDHERDHLCGLGDEVLGHDEVVKLVVQKKIGSREYRYAIQSENLTDKHLGMMMKGVKEGDEFFSEEDREIINSRSRV